MSGHAENIEEIKSDAFKWIFGAGAGAILLSLFLVAADYGLSHSDSEKRLGDTLRELRTAQSQMASRVTDSRQTQNSVYSQNKE